MKTIKSLKASYLFMTLLAAVSATEFLAWKICAATGVRFDAIVVGTITVGLVVAFVDWRYVGRE